MAVIEQALISFFTNDAGVAALISGRVFGMVIPQGTILPCLTIQRISTPRELTHDTLGASTLAHPRFQFDAWATTMESAKAITDAIRTALNGKSGEVGTAPNNVIIRAALVAEEHTEYETQTGFYRSQSDYFIWQEE